MDETRLTIRKPDDSGNYWETTLRAEDYTFKGSSVAGVRTAKDAIQAGLEKFWLDNLKVPRESRYSYYRNMRYFKGGLIYIGSCPVMFQRNESRVSINGQTMSLKAVCSVLSRLTYKSCFETEPTKLMTYLYNLINIPENVRYCLENRVPYQFYNLLETHHPIKVRLNVQQISDKEVAIEVSDGVWGTMTLKELDTFCSVYRDGSKRSKWVATSPLELFTRTVGRRPSLSELQVMKAFLEQNRTSKIVEERAIQLVREMEEQYPERLRVIWNEDNTSPTAMYVRGKGWDWKITDNRFKSEIQKVSTFVYQPRNREDDDGNTYVEKIWSGPICIDNMTKGSSLGDQFVARALALLNDTMTVKMVGTINRYLNTKEDEFRCDLNEYKM